MRIRNAAAAMVLWAAAAEAETLKIFPDSFLLQLTGLNDQGKLTGAFVLGENNLRSVILDALTDESKDLPTLKAGETGFVLARKINNFGQTIGYKTTIFAGQAYTKGIIIGDGIRYFKIPGADNTFGEAINDNGGIAGSFTVQGQSNAFFQAVPKGKIKTIAFPGAITTYIADINNLNVMVGYFTYQNADGDTRTSGFLHRDGTNKYTRIDVTGSSVLLPISTRPTGINDSGEVVGWFQDEDEDITRGFVRSPDGQFRFLDLGNSETRPWDINNHGEIVGTGVNIGAGSFAFFYVP